MIQETATTAIMRETGKNLVTVMREVTAVGAKMILVATVTKNPKSEEALSSAGDQNTLHSNIFLNQL
jgi:hypothetical protein